MTRPSPYLVELQAGRRYLWCRCGRSQGQPWCDGSHRGSGVEPLEFRASRTEERLLCGCRTTADAPFCDGAHNNLPGGSPLDDPHSAENLLIPVVSAADGRCRLNGDCHIVSSRVGRSRRHEGLGWRPLVTPAMGAHRQSQLLLEVECASSPVFSLGEREVILFVADGAGTVGIGGRDFEVSTMDAVYVRPAESVQLRPQPGALLRVFLSSSPPGEIDWRPASPASFDARFPHRRVSVDVRQRTEMGPRYFQRLVDARVGSHVLTQFIGHIPRSKAAPHRHLYEETLIVLQGEGYLWTQDRKAAVGPGDVLFLPPKQLHSLEATADSGLDVVGVICPGDNPSLAYHD